MTEERKSIIIGSADEFISEVELRLKLGQNIDSPRRSMTRDADILSIKSKQYSTPIR